MADHIATFIKMAEKQLQIERLVRLLNPYITAEDGMYDDRLFVQLVRDRYIEDSDGETENT